MVQPTGKQMTKEQKKQKVKEFQQKIEKYPIVGILDMHNLPSKQLQEMKKETKDFADIKMSRKTLIHLALENSSKQNVEDLKDNDAIQPAFIFSEKDPFQLFKLIQDNKTSAAAQGGETAPDDIEVSDGDTGIGPGPMLGKLQQAGLNVQVEDGSIHVQEPGVIVEQGQTIDGDTAEILNQLGIEPLEIGLDLKLVYSDGDLFDRNALDIDEEEYRSDLEAAAGRAFNLAVNAGHITDRTAPTVISEAGRKARNLSISEGIPTGETIEDILANASSNAEGLDSQLELEDVEVEEEGEGTEEETESNSEETENAEDRTEESGDSDDIDYSEIVSQSIDDAKEDIDDLEDPDFDALIEAEKDGKDRKTFIEWLEDQ